uniref:Uncharacterized protein n=1 Tax=Anopheles melas TaxID=34690 RepID=A0A182UID2_9DIPT
MSSTPRYSREAIDSWAVSYVPRCPSRRCCYCCSVWSRSCPTVRSTPAPWPTTLPAAWNRCYAIRTVHHRSSDLRTSGPQQQLPPPPQSNIHIPSLTPFLVFLL